MACFHTCVDVIATDADTQQTRHTQRQTYTGKQVHHTSFPTVVVFIDDSCIYVYVCTCLYMYISMDIWIYGFLESGHYVSVDVTFRASNVRSDFGGVFPAMTDVETVQRALR